MSNYFDNSHIDGKQLTPKQIADAIRHKKFGVDVREAMAQGLEYCMTQVQKVDKLEQDLSDLSKRVTALEVLPSEIAKITNEVAGIEQDIGTINDEINKLNVAVFGNGAVPIDTQIDSNNQTNKAQEVHLN